MQLERVVCAEKIIVNMADSKVSAINLLDDIQSTRFPVALQLMIFLKLSKTPDEAIGNLSLQVKLDEEVIGRNPIDFEFSNELHIGGTVINAGFIPVVRPGTLSFSIVIENVQEPLQLEKFIIRQTPIGENMPVPPQAA